MSEYDPDSFEPYDPGLAELERLSNSVVDLIEHRRLGAAARACARLKREYPEVIDWIDRAAMLHEARGETRQAVDKLRECIEFIETNPDGFDEESKDYYRNEIERLRSRCESAESVIPTLGDTPH